MATSSSEILVSHEISFNIPRKLRVLVAISGAFCLVVSTLYLFMLLYPQIVFTGYIHGYLSLVSYELRYNTNGGSITLFNLDAVKMVAVATTGYAVILAIVTMFAMLYLRRNTLLSTSLIYGVSASLVVTSGVLRYLSQAFAIDAGILMSYANNGGVIKLRTLAGSIEYIGITAEKTFAYNLLFTHPLITLILLYASIVSSTVSIMWLIYIYSKPSSSRREQNIEVKLIKPFWKTLTKMFAFIVTIIGIALTYTGASVFTYYPSSIIVTPQPPPATFEAPPYTYTCTGLTKTNRSALAYTDFETYPVSGWATSGGIWSTVSDVTGAKGNVTQGSDNNAGLGGASHYYYGTDLSARDSLWVVAKTRWTSGTGSYGVVLGRSPFNRMYTVEITDAGTLRIRSYGVTVATAWDIHTSVTIPGYSQKSWYIVVVYYKVVERTITIDAYLYDAGGNYVTSASATVTHPRVFSPAYLGVTVDNTTAYFDDFIISTTDPRSILFKSFYSGMGVEVWDNLGNLVDYTTALADSFYLNIAADIVVGTGVDGRVVVKYPDTYMCGVLRVLDTDAILGGDVYNLTTRSIAAMLGANKTSANIVIYLPGLSMFSTTARVLRLNASQAFYARLLLDNISAPSTLNLDLWIEGATKSTNITVRSGVPVSASTSIVQLNLGLNNNLTLAGYFTSTSQSATLNLGLELCTMPGNMGACVYYPIVLNLLS